MHQDFDTINVPVIDIDGPASPSIEAGDGMLPYDSVVDELEPLISSVVAMAFPDFTTTELWSVTLGEPDKPVSGRLLILTIDDTELANLSPYEAEEIAHGFIVGGVVSGLASMAASAGMSWTRAACHLAYRFEQAGCRDFASWIVDPTGREDAIAGCLESLESECREFRSDSLSSIVLKSSRANTFPLTANDQVAAAIPENAPSNEPVKSAVVNHWWYGYRDKLEGGVSDIIRSELNEDGGARLSIVFKSEVPIAVHSTHIGLACNALNLMSEVTEAVGIRHSDDGPVIIIDDSGFELFPNTEPGRFAVSRFINSLVCHEASHTLTWTRSFIAKSEGLAPNEVDRAKGELVKPSSEFSDSVGRPQWIGHEPDWMRSALHLSERMTRAGYPVNLSTGRPIEKLNFEHYGYSPETVYAQILKEELASQADVPIRKIVRCVPVPTLFLKRWLIDIGEVSSKTDSAPALRLAAMGESLHGSGAADRMTCSHTDLNEFRASLRKEWAEWIRSTNSHL